MLDFWPVVFAVSCLYLVLRKYTAKSNLENIPGPPRTSWWNGYVGQAYDLNGWNFHRDIVQKYGRVVKLPMSFGHDEVYVTDPLALHHILVKDQYIYEETPSFIGVNKVVIGGGLLSILGEAHRKQRKMLNPVFSMKHMRDLLPIFYPIAYDLRNILAEKVHNGENEVDLMLWVSRAALDFIGQAGFGYAFNALHDDEASEYGEYFKKIIPLISLEHRYRYILQWVLSIGSSSLRRKVVESIPSKFVKEQLDAVNVLDAQSNVIYQEKKKLLDDGDEVNGRKVDIMSVLLKANREASESDRLPEDQIIGQINSFVIAGQDTTSHAISRILHLLSLHPHVQTRLREGIIAARKERGGNDFDYDMLMGLPYLDAVCRETLRLYPPVSYVARQTTKDVVMPLAWPILGADRRTEISEVPLRKGTAAIVSIIGTNRDKKIWGEDAEEWKPERWLQLLPDSVAKARVPGVYSSLMTFAGGSRACIGFKFAEMEMKLVLSILLEAFEFHPGPDVEWKMTGVAYPVLKHSADGKEKMPLKVSLVKY